MKQPVEICNLVLANAHVPCDIGLMQNSTGIVAGNTVCICNCVFVFSGTQKIESLK